MKRIFAILLAFLLLLSSAALAEADYAVKRAAYERIYGKPLTYDFEPSDIAGWRRAHEA